MAQIFNRAVVDGKVIKTPCVDVKLPTNREPTEMHFLTPEQVRDLADAFVDDRYRALIYTAAYSGLRAGG